MVVRPNPTGSSGHQTNGRTETNFGKVEPASQNGDILLIPTCSHVLRVWSETWQLTGISERPNITAN